MIELIILVLIVKTGNLALLSNTKGVFPISSSSKLPKQVLSQQNPSMVFVIPFCWHYHTLILYRFTAIDSVHNLFLGTGKHIFCVPAGIRRRDFHHLFHLVMVHSQLVSGKIGSLSVLLYFWRNHTSVGYSSYVLVLFFVVIALEKVIYCLLTCFWNSFVVSVNVSTIAPAAPLICTYIAMHLKQINIPWLWPTSCILVFCIWTL